MPNKNTYPVLGMSPGNSYFKDDEVRYLLKSLVEKHGRVAVLVADVPAISTYIAFGYSENRARRDKAIPKGNNLKNRVKRAMKQLGYTDEVVNIIEWAEEIEEDEKYQKHYEAIENLYKQNQSFHDSAYNTTRSVLENSGRDIKDLDEATDIAIHYLLSEFAFLEFAPEFLNADHVVYVYHKNWPVYEDYIAGKFDNQPKSRLGFRLLENPWETYNPIWGLEDDEDKNNNFKNALSRVNKTGILRVGFSNYPPALMYDRDYDNFSGIFYEIIISIARQNGWQAKWAEETGYGVVTDGLQNNRFDVFGSPIWPIPERKGKAVFSSPLYKSPVFPWVKKGDEDIELNHASSRVVVKENDISHSIAVADYPNAQLVFVPQLAETIKLLEFVADDKGDFTFTEPYLAKTLNRKTGKSLAATTKEPIRIYDNHFTFKESDTSLKEVFDREIAKLKSGGELEQLIKKYAGDNMPAFIPTSEK